MQVCMDSPNKLKQYKSKKVQSTHNSAIFELKTPYFAWKFIWTVQPNDKVQKDKIQKYNTKKFKMQNIKM